MSVSDEHGAGGTMDMGEHLRTWRQFVGLVKWSIGSIALVMLLLFIFRTHN